MCITIASYMIEMEVEVSFREGRFALYGCPDPYLVRVINTYGNVLAIDSPLSPIIGNMYMEYFGFRSMPPNATL